MIQEKPYSAMSGWVPLVLCLFCIFGVPSLLVLAAVVELQHGKFTRADLAFGGLAHKPWHDPRIADALIGQAPSDDLYDTAADLLLEDAQGHGENEFKIPLARRTLHAVLKQAVEEAA